MDKQILRERERCANIAEELAEHYNKLSDDFRNVDFAAKAECARMISEIIRSGAYWGERNQRIKP